MCAIPFPGVSGFLIYLCVLCVSAVNLSRETKLTAKTQRPQRTRREDLELGHYRFPGEVASRAELDISSRPCCAHSFSSFSLRRSFPPSPPKPAQEQRPNVLNG